MERHRLRGKATHKKARLCYLRRQTANEVSFRLVLACQVGMSNPANSQVYTSRRLHVRISQLVFLGGTPSTLTQLNINQTRQ